MNMPGVRPRSRRPSRPSAPAARRGAWLAVPVALLVGAAGCTTVTPDATGTGPPTSTPAVTDRATPTAAPTETAAPTPTSTPEPPLSLPIAAVRDPRQVSVSVTTEVAPDAGGQIIVTVTSAATDVIDELVLRWPSDLGQTLFLSPRLPDPDLVREGGGNLEVPWTKWVLGPGEQGEPAGTVSLGYGPLEAGATLSIPLYVTRLAPGPVAFDLQVLARETILTLPEGGPAELRVEVP